MMMTLLQRSWRFSSLARWRQWLWRWHFYAGLLVCPFIIVLSLSGTAYLFKPQIDAWEEARIHQHAEVMPATPQPQALSADVLWQSAQQAFPNAKMVRTQLPSSSEDRSVEFDLRPLSPDGVLMPSRRVWVDRYTGDVLATKVNSQRFLSIMQRLHSELLMGRLASYVVELAASWALILVITGICLWMTRKPNRSNAKSARSASSPANTTDNQAPSRFSKQRARKWHSRLGIWIAVPLVLLIVTGLPWSQLWGNGFKAIKAQLGWSGPGQEWRITLQSSSPKAVWPKDADQQLWQLNPEEPKAVSLPTPASAPVIQDNPVTLGSIAAMPEWQTVAPPVIILPPKPDNGVWSVRGLSQQRSKRVTVHFDQHTGEEIMRIRFEDHHPIQRFVSQGIALHEGALFGPPNQWLGLLTALGTVALSVLGVMAWWKRRPIGRLAAPPAVPEHLPTIWVMVCLCLGVLLPTAGISMLVLLGIHTVISTIKWLFNRPLRGSTT